MSRLTSRPPWRGPSSRSGRGRAQGEDQVAAALDPGVERLRDVDGARRAVDQRRPPKGVAVLEQLAPVGRHGATLAPEAALAAARERLAQVPSRARSAAGGRPRSGARCRAGGTRGSRSAATGASSRRARRGADGSRSRARRGRPRRGARPRRRWSARGTGPRIASRPSAGTRPSPGRSRSARTASACSRVSSSKTSLICSAVTAVRSQTPARVSSRPTSMVNIPIALSTGAASGQCTSGTPSRRAISAPWIPPAPPPATSAKPRTSRPCFVHASVTASAITPLTVSKMASAASSVPRPERLRRPSRSPRSPGPGAGSPRRRGSSRRAGSPGPGPRRSRSARSARP